MFNCNINLFMNKKIITGFLMFALAVFSMSSFVRIFANNLSNRLKTFGQPLARLRVAAANLKITLLRQNFNRLRRSLMLSRRHLIL